MSKNIIYKTELKNVDPQVPGGEYIGAFENIAFYASLWLMVGVACLLIKFSADLLGVRAGAELYTLESVIAE